MLNMAIISIIGRRYIRCLRLSWRFTSWVYICALMVAFFLSGLNCVFNPNGLLSVGRYRRAESCLVSSFLPSSGCFCNCDDSVVDMENPEGKPNVTNTSEFERTYTIVASTIERLSRQPKNSGKAAGKINLHIISEIVARKTKEGLVTKEQEQLLLEAFERYSQTERTAKDSKKISKGVKNKGVKKRDVYCKKDYKGSPNEGERKWNIMLDNAKVVRGAPELMYKDNMGIEKVVSWSSAVLTARDSYNLTAVKEPFRTWTPNSKNKDSIRKQLIQECCMSRDNMVATQSNVAPGTRFALTFDPDLSYTVTKNFYSAFPSTTPFPSEPFRTCAVVGNSGILRRSKCGSQIDKADYVFRINMPPMTGKEAHAHDVGSKTNFTTAISSLVKRFQRYAGKREQVLKSLEYLNGLLFIRKPTGYLLAVNQILQDAGRPLRLVYQNPNHYMAVNDFWNKHDLHITITTGLYVLSSALTLCEEITAYGFWPFPITELGGKVPYHYYVGTIFLPPKDYGAVYDMATEFMAIRDLHRLGVVRVVTDRCDL